MYQTAKQSAEACKVNLPEFKYVKKCADPCHNRQSTPVILTYILKCN